MSTPTDCRYTKEHEWARPNGDGTVTIGITAHAAEALGDVVYVELPETGTQLQAEQAFGVVESVKAVSDLYAPCGGEVVEVNEALEAAPEKVNEDPHGEGWIVRVKTDDALDGLMDAAGYDAFVAQEG